MPRNQGRRKGTRHANGSGSNVDRYIANQQKPTGSTTAICPNDYTRRLPNFNRVPRPPKNITGQIYWADLHATTKVNVSSTVITEYNQSFVIGTLNNSAALLSAFDQYFIYSVLVTMTSNTNVTTPLRVHTAIDYDSVTNLGLISDIQGFSTYQYFNIAGDGSTSASRYFKPCIASYVNNASNVPTPYGVQRAWVDSAGSSTQHYGFRSIIDLWLNTGVDAIDFNFTVRVAFQQSF